MKKLAIVSIVLLLAGMASALGQAGSCICPDKTSCAQSECLENCSGSCAPGENNASSCIGSCPIAKAGSASGDQACCAANFKSCCGAANK